MQGTHENYVIRYNDATYCLIQMTNTLSNRFDIGNGLRRRDSNAVFGYWRKFLLHNCIMHTHINVRALLIPLTDLLNRLAKSLTNTLMMKPKIWMCWSLFLIATMQDKDHFQMRFWRQIQLHSAHRTYRIFSIYRSIKSMLFLVGDNW